MTTDSTFSEWLRRNPPGQERFEQTLAGVAQRTRQGADFRVAVRELLDEYALLQTDDQRERALADRPAATGEERFDAFLGALAEHLAARGGLERPGWAVEPGRFLERLWFVSDEPGFRALAISQSPAAFRRRGIFISTGALERV